ncbi:MAG: DUF1553 domain-containing protein, partial [Verrucomicrobiota bacterium]
LAPDDPLAMMATGFMGAGVYPTQITTKEAERVRYDAMDDMLATTGNAMLALTIGCARCHDHKYDPIPIRDYYQLLSAFTTTVRSEIDINMTPENMEKELAAFEQERERRKTELDAFEREELKQRLTDWLSKTGEAQPEKKAPWDILYVDDFVSEGGADFTRQGDGSVVVSGKNAKFDVYRIKTRTTLKKLSALRLEAMAHSSLVRGGPGRASNGNMAVTDFHVMAKALPDGEEVRLNLATPRATFEQNNHSLSVKATIDDDKVSGWAVDPQFGKNHAAIYDVIDAPVFETGAELTFHLRFENNGQHNIGRPRLSVSELPASQLPFSDGQTVGRFVRIDLPGRNRILTLAEVEVMSGGKNVARTGKAGQSSTAFNGPAAKAIDGNRAGSFGAGTSTHTVEPATGEPWWEVDLGSAVPIQSIGIWNRSDLHQGKSLGYRLDGFKLSVLDEDRQPVFVREKIPAPIHEATYAVDTSQQDASIQSLLALKQEIEGPPSEAQWKQMLGIYKQIDGEWSKRQAAYTAFLNTRPKGRKEKVQVTSEGFRPMRHHTAVGSIKDFYDKTFHLNRGDANQKGEEADLGFLQVLMRHPDGSKHWFSERPPNARTSHRRAGLARWITDTEYGAGHLAARAIVNRLWHYHLGRGFVPSLNDFGLQADSPSHPDLLEWLAKDLVENNWKLKRVHKAIMMSRAYRLSNAPHPDNQAIDPDNHFFWRRDKRRLEAEIIRDNLLTVSGVLDKTMYGPGTLNEGMKRRSIYFMIKRSKLIPFMQAFDWPDTLTSTGVRANTIVAPQALIFMNNPHVKSYADAFARRVQSEASGTPEAIITRAYELAFSRPPSAEEHAIGLDFFEGRDDFNQVLNEYCQALLSLNEFVYVQ